VLPRNARLTSPSDFTRTTKSGIRVTSHNFVGYLHINAAENSNPRAGLIVGKSVGGSVQRHRLSRQIRHSIAPLMQNLPQGSLLVIRALKDSKSVDAEISELLNQLITRSKKFSSHTEVKAQ
jgi:ribonuclease P protein component